MDHYMAGLEIKRELLDKQGQSLALINIGRLFSEMSEYREAIRHCRKGLEIADSLQLLNLQHDACDCLYSTYKILGNSDEALSYHERLFSLKDSLQNVELVKELQQADFNQQILLDSIRTEEEKLRVELIHREEIRQKTQVQNGLLVLGAFLLILASGLFLRSRYMRRSRDMISKEKERSESLLLNILPYQIAQELKEKGEAEARNFEAVTILFTDFKEFTRLSLSLSAQQLVEEINCCFKKFDEICEKYKVEKIKTIGDAYMAAGGIPAPSEGDCKRTVMAAFEMMQFISERKEEKLSCGEVPFEMRAGIHTGNVVAGIVGVKKFQYDIWGDTVNTASRMESNGVPGQINISQSTYEILKDDPDLAFESRGMIQVKGKGDIEMWFVSLRNNSQS